MADNWTDKEIEQFFLSKGPGEFSIRMRLNLPLISTLERADLPDNNEVKNVMNEKQQKMLFKLGRCGTEVLEKFVENKTNDLMNGLICKEDYSKINKSEINQKTINSLTAAVRNEFCNAMMFSKTAPYRNIYLTMPFGFIVVPRQDFDRAFVFKSITQNTLKYDLNKDYFERLAGFEVLPNCAAVDEIRHNVDKIREFTVPQYLTHSSSADIVKSLPTKKANVSFQPFIFWSVIAAAKDVIVRAFKLMQ